MNNGRRKTIAFLVGIGLLTLGATLYRTTAKTFGPVASQHPAKPTLSNKTAAVEVISIQPLQSGGFELTMKNTSAKNINGYSIAFDNGASVTSDLTSTYKPIVAPGEEFKLQIPVTSVVIIKDVVFDDNSFDGDAQMAAQLQGRRIGIQKQLRNIVDLLNREGKTADVEQLKAKIKELPEQGSSFVAAGMRNAKDDALLALQKTDSNDKAAKLNKLLEQSNRRLALLQGTPN
jgi:hypothetical protein